MTKSRTKTNDTGTMFETQE